MLKRKFRLGNAKVKFTGTYSTPYFLLKSAQNNLSYNRYRFVVSKKVGNKAVDRNRNRRKLSHCIEELFEDFKKGYDFIFIARKEIDNIQEADLQKVIKGVLKNGGFLS